MGKDSWQKAALAWIAIILLLVVSIKLFYKPHEDFIRSYPEFLQYIEASKSKNGTEHVISVNIRSDNLKGDEISAKVVDDKSGASKTVTTYGPADDGVRASLRTKLDEKKIPINYERPDDGGGWWVSFLTMWLPLILIIGFMFIFLRNMQGAGGKALSFGKSRAKLQSDMKVTFKDVAGVEEAKEECQEIVTFLKDHKRFHEIGARIPKGVLMIGPPGTGKTLLARAIAGEAGVPFFTISGSDFVEMFVGVGASRVRDLFENAKKNSPCIIFIDEIDAVGRHRGAGIGGGHDEREQTLNQLLVEMDGFESNEAVIVIAATNRPDVLDPALLRPGRFDRRVTVGLPDARGRKEILNVHMKKIKHVESINVERIALGTPGFSGADLENLCNEAALMAARNNNTRVSEKDFENAKDKILMGPERKSMILSKELINETAYHETGHALVSYFLKSKENVHKITVIPRGQALGVTSYLPKEDVYSYSKDDLMTRVACAMGGRAAEDIKFSRFTTGAANDIQQATEVARRMVCQYGMSRLGPINYGQKHENPFLGRDWSEQRNYSDTVANQIDVEVSQIINSQYEIAKQILIDHMDIFERVTHILVNVETLDNQEFLEIIQNSDITLDEIKEIQKNKALSGKDDANSSNKISPEINPTKLTPTPA